MSFDLTKEADRQKAFGHEQVTAFSGRVPSVDATYLEVGDIVKIPEDINRFKFQHSIDGTTRKAQYVLCTVHRDGKDYACRLYLSSLWKSRVSLDDNNQEVGTITAGGEVVNDIRSFTHRNDAINSLAGASLLIAHRYDVKTWQYGSDTETQITPIYDFEYADNVDARARHL